MIEAASNAGSSLSEDTRAALKRAQAHHTGALPLPFSPWRLRHCALNPKLVAAHRQVWTLYSEGVDERFASFRRGTFAPSAAAYPLLDAVGYRVPTAVCGEARQRVQRGLGTHLDLNPAEPWADLKVYSAHNSENGEELAYWRPLQCFVALTDGVFLCAEGLHVSVFSLKCSLSLSLREVLAYSSAPRAFKLAPPLFYRSSSTAATFTAQKYTFIAQVLYL